MDRLLYLAEGRLKLYGVRDEVKALNGRRKNRYRGCEMSNQLPTDNKLTAESVFRFMPTAELKLKVPFYLVC